VDTEIRFLRELREDLMEAAWREELGRAAGGLRRRPPRAAGRRGLVLGAVALATLLAASAAVGSLVGLRPTGRAPSMRVRSLVVRNGVEAATIPAAAPTPATADLAGGEAAPADAGGSLEKVVRTAALAVVVPRGSFRERFAEAADVAERFGGFVESSETQGGRAGRLVLRVQAARFREAMDALRSLGRVERQSLRGRVVTGEYVDLRARLRIALERRRILRELQAKAGTVGEVLRVQRALDQTQLEIEQVLSRLRTLDRLTEMATITIALREEGAEVSFTEPVARAPSLGAAFRHAVAGFFRVVFAVIVGLGYVLPVAVAVAVVAALGWLVLRRVRAPG
jgi:hypothetical protein